jgi:hypothetical protein
VREAGIIKKVKKLLKKLNDLEKMCYCGDPRDPRDDVSSIRARFTTSWLVETAEKPCFYICISYKGE